MPARDDDDDRTARQIARSKRRQAGDRSARLANALMKLPAPALKELELDEQLREVIERTRAVTAHIARRRAERTLAGELRRFDLPELDEQLARIAGAGQVDAQHFHLAEQWRTKLIEGGAAAAEAFPSAGPGGVTDELLRLIDAAQRERATGRPPGAARALFRHIANALKNARAADD